MITEQRRLGGRLVTTGGQGGSGPPVVLLGGCGVSHVMWDAVIVALPGRRVVWLDRPGVGGTPWPGRLPTLSEEVATVAELAAREDAAVVLVAHSMAGPHAEAMVRQYPRLVAGLVLVDPSVEWRPPVGAGRVAVWDGWARAARWLLDRRPVQVLATPVVGRAMHSRVAGRRGVTSEMADALTGIWLQPDTQASIVAELGAYAGQITELYAVRARHPWPGTPTEVLTAERGSTRTWFACQRRLARLLGAGHQVVDSSHNMMLARPQTIADAVGRATSPTG